MKKAVVLFSSGLDSTTVLYKALKDNYEVYCVTFDYGQKHALEIHNAKKLIANLPYKIQHSIIKINSFGGSALNDDIEVPKDNQDLESIPVTYVPARNLLFLSHALAYAEVIEAYDIFIGANSIDYSQYPDCRPEFIKSFETTANLATKAGVEGNKITIHAPLQYLSKKDIIALGFSLGVDYSMTRTCYDPHDEDLACGRCDACNLRKSGFEQLGTTDPIKYAV